MTSLVQRAERDALAAVHRGKDLAGVLRRQAETLNSGLVRRPIVRIRKSGGRVLPWVVEERTGSRWVYAASTTRWKRALWFAHQITARRIREAQAALTNDVQIING